MSISLVSGIIIWTCDFQGYRDTCDPNGVTFYRDHAGVIYAMCKKHNVLHPNVSQELSEDEVLCHLISEM